MKIIEQEDFMNLEIKIGFALLVQQSGESIAIDTAGAKQLIKVLQEYVDEKKDIESEALRLNNLG